MPISITKKTIERLLTIEHVFKRANGDIVFDYGWAAKLFGVKRTDISSWLKVGRNRNYLKAEKLAGSVCRLEILWDNVTNYKNTIKKIDKYELLKGKSLSSLYNIEEDSISNPTPEVEAEVVTETPVYTQPEPKPEPKPEVEVYDFELPTLDEPAFAQPTLDFPTLDTKIEVSKQKEPKIEISNFETTSVKGPFGQLNVVVDSDGNPYFRAKEVCNILGLSNVTETLRRVDSKDQSSVQLNLGQKPVKVINESGLYQVIFMSKKKEAHIFRRWVYDEVLPSIRKHGAYMTPTKIEEILSDPDTIIKLATDLKREREEKQRLQLEKQKVEEELVILKHSKKLYTTTELAKEFGYRSAKELNEILREKGIQYKVNKTWVLTAKYSDMGYDSIKQHILENGVVIYDRKWTQRGREFLADILNIKNALSKNPI